MNFHVFFFIIITISIVIVFILWNSSCEQQIQELDRITALMKTVGELEGIDSESYKNLNGEKGQMMEDFNRMCRI